jgi:polyhydroxyalkanoate synthesis repressor PhaR
MPKTIVIKRYGNRRLYNSETRSYVKLQDIASFIRSGLDIQVLDSRTGEDITKLVLTQIILEEEKSKKDLLPLSFLYDLIRHQQGWFQEFFQRHVVKALEGYLPSRGELLTQLRQSLDFRSASAGFLDRWLHRGEGAEKGGAARQVEPAQVPAQALEPGTPIEAAEPGESVPLDALEDLVERIAAVESRMRRIEEGLAEQERA